MLCATQVDGIISQGWINLVPRVSYFPTLKGTMKDLWGVGGERPRERGCLSV